MHKVAGFGYGSSIVLSQGNHVAADFDGHVARVAYALGFKAQVLISRLAVLAQGSFDGSRSLGGIVPRRDELTIARK